MTNINELENSIAALESKVNKKTSKYGIKPINSQFLSRVISDVIASFVVSFALYKLYVHFFSKNILIFILLLVLSCLAAFYNIARSVLKKYE